MKFYYLKVVPLDSSPLLPSFWRLGAILSASILVHPQAFMMPSINVMSLTSFALMQPHIITLPPPCFSQNYEFPVVVPVSFMPNMLGTSETNTISSDQRMCSQYSSDLFSCSLANFNLAVLCQRSSKVFFLNASIEVDTMHFLSNCHSNFDIHG